MNDFGAVQMQNVLRKRFPRVQILQSTSANGEESLLLRRRNLVETLRFLQNDPDARIDSLVDLSAIHHLGNESCNFEKTMEGGFYEVFYLLRSTRLRYRLRLSVFVPEIFAGVPTVSDIFQNAHWLERELWEFFGIFVEGHPDLRNLLLYPTFVSYPLNKNYPLNQKQPLVSTRSS